MSEFLQINNNNSGVYLDDLPKNNYQDEIDNAKKDLLNILESSFEGWTPYEDKDGVKTYTKITEQAPVPALRATCKIKGTIEQFRAVFEPSELRQEYDSTLQSSNIVEYVDPNTTILETKFNAPWPVTSRDVCAVCSYIPLNTDGTKILLITTSVEHEKCPENTKFVRMTMMYMGYIAEVDENDSSYINIRFACLSTPNGNVPNCLVSATIGKAVAAFIAAKKKIEKDSKFTNKCVDILRRNTSQALSQYIERTSQTLQHQQDNNNNNNESTMLIGTPLEVGLKNNASTVVLDL